MSHFNHLTMQPADSVFGVLSLCNADPRPDKINLTVGSYKNNLNQPQVFRAVVKAEHRLLEEHLNKEYLPMDGDPLYCQLTAELIFGSQASALQEKKIYTCQTIGGSGGLKLGGEFLREIGHNKIYISQPTWENHINIFSHVGLLTESYTYYDTSTKHLDFPGMCASIEKIPEGSLLLLHTCCHNPTGLDPTVEQWKILSQLLKKKKILPFFDFAYQGLKEGLDKDAFPIRLFLEDGHEHFLVSSSYSKNFGLYGERMGTLSIVASSSAQVSIIASYMKRIIRSIYSSPPLQGARIIRTVLKDPTLKAEWLSELEEVKNRIHQVRQEIIRQLNERGYGALYQFMNHQHGMFCYMGLDKTQVQTLREKNGIYMLDNSRINVAGLNEHNINAFIEALISVSY